MMYGLAFEQLRTSGVRRSPTPQMTGKFRSLVFFTVVETTRLPYSRMSRRIETRAVRVLKPTVVTSHLDFERDY
jgi:hypothetical protein